MSDEARRFPLFPEWEQAHAGQMAEQVTYPPRLLSMWRVYGRAAEGLKCKTCVHCIQVNHNANRYYKCDMNKITRGAGSDWRQRWPACGKHEAKNEGS